MYRGGEHGHVDRVVVVVQWLAQWLAEDHHVGRAGPGGGAVALPDHGEPDE